MESHASLRTDKASRYLAQLCKHWGHRFPVRFDSASGEVELPAGPLVLTADDAELRLTLKVADPETLARLEDVVASHLARFAFREGEVRLAWTRAWPAGSIDLGRMPGLRPASGPGPR